MITLVIRRRHIQVLFSLMLFVGYFLLTGNVFATLSCTVATSCPTGTVIFRMSSTSNAHAELPSQSTYPQVVCCSGITGLSNSCTGIHAVVTHLSSTTNAHSEQNIFSTFSQNSCLQVPSGDAITVAYQDGNCSGFDTTVVSIASTSNSHVGDANTYVHKICASATESTLTFGIDSASENFSVIAGSSAATTSILFAKTGNASGFNVSVQKSTSPTLSLISNPAVTIPDKTQWAAPVATTTAGNGSLSSNEPVTLQFRVRQLGTDSPNFSTAWWGVDDTSPNALYAGLPISAQTIINRGTAAAATTTSYVLYNLTVSSGQTVGTYSGSITYTAIVNP